MFRLLREQFDPSHVLLKASIAERFQRSMLDPSCRDFKSALLGLVASMIHDLAVSVFEHLHGSKYSNKPHPGVERPTLPDFRHSKYLRARSYPRGPIELVGYWMETRIFGGVVVFEHGNPPGEPDTPWVHLPYRGIVRLSDAKLDAFTELAFSNSPVGLFGSDPDDAAVSSVLPFQRDPDSHVVDSYDAYRFGLFRNEFEHVPPPAISRFPRAKMDVSYQEELLEELRKS